MFGASNIPNIPTPTLVPLGESALLVRFGNALSETANRAAISLGVLLERQPLPGVLEVMPNLVSVLLRFDPLQTSLEVLAGEVRLLIHGLGATAVAGREWVIPVSYDGPDLADAAHLLGMTKDAFTAGHKAASLRVLATGFAPGFVYCGLHEPELVLPRRTAVRPAVAAGSVLFAVGQTAITATEMPTGWYVIGRTIFNNFDATTFPPTQMQAGDRVRFKASP